MNRLIQTVVLSCVFFVLGCASTNVQEMDNSFSEKSREIDEVELWELADSNEQEILERLEEYDFSELELYLELVMFNVLHDRLSNQDILPRIKVVPDTSINAFVMPNGAMYINTGLLSVIENETQLAFVLSHELSHFILRHGLRQMRTDKNNAKVGMALGIFVAALAGGGSGIYDNNLSKSVSDLWELSRNNVYSRDLEREADIEGMRLLTDSYYDVHSGKKILEIMLAEAEREGYEGAGMFSSHPEIEERIATASDLTQKSSEGFFIGKNEYNEKILPAVLLNSRMNVDSGRFDVAYRDLERYHQENSETADSLFLMGEIIRRSKKERWREAVSYYSKAVELDSSKSNAYLELGYLYRSQKMKVEAISSFEKYISLNADALDVPIINKVIHELRE